MQQEQLDRFRRWFDEYTNRFLNDDDYVNANLRLKQEHTRRTCQESVYLASELALDENQTRIAELVALFHDIGRFPQFTQYRTYNDPRSVDHCRLGVEVLRQEGILDVLPAEERRWVETAIELHGRKSLPADLGGQTLLSRRRGGILA
jgi:HD superfamily phosphodiesterase